MMDNEHVPLARKVARNFYQAHKNMPIDPVRPQVEKNAGEAQKNAPDNYVFQKKEW